MFSRNFNDLDEPSLLIFKHTPVPCFLREGNDYRKHGAILTNVRIPDTFGDAGIHQHDGVFSRNNKNNMKKLTDKKIRENL